MKRVLLVGNSSADVTNQLIDRLHAAGSMCIVLEDIRKPTTAPNDGDQRWIRCDFSSRESILEAVARLPQSVDAVMTLHENYVLPCAWICKYLGFDGMSEASALACTDKFLMREAFRKSPEPISPDYALVDGEETVRQFAATHQFPLILKPANLVKSLLVTKNDSLDELLENYHHTARIIDDVYKQYAPNRQPAIIVEEFLVGSMHSVAGFADSSGEMHIVDQIVDLKLARDIGYNDNFLYCRSLPSTLSETDQKALRECARLGMQTLGMKSSPAHVEIILTKDGPRIVEIGARLGGYRDRMYRLANGIELLTATADIASGKKPKLGAIRHEQCAVFELFPKNPGVFKGISNAAKVPSLSSHVYFNIKANPGDYVGKAADGYKCCAVIILHHADARQLATDVAIINEFVRVETSETAGKKG